LRRNSGALAKRHKKKSNPVQKTKQITRAMNMVAASKFKAAQLKMENFRPYAGKFMDVLNSLALRVESMSHPLLAVRDPKRLRIICMTSDRGLCGGFNTNLIKATERFIKDKVKDGKEVSLINVGRKGRDYFRKKADVIAQKTDVLNKFDMTLAVSIADEVITPFIKEEYDELYLIYNQFVNVSVQKPTVVRLFPLPSIGQETVDVDPDRLLDYAYEPSEEALMQRLCRCMCMFWFIERCWKRRRAKTERGWLQWIMRPATAKI
jgi:F-type H+-transporting ATPase subunit gamma